MTHQFFKLTSFAIRITILQEERRITEQLATIDAIETFRMEVLSDSLQAILQNTSYYFCRSKETSTRAKTYGFNLGVTFRTWWSQILLKAVLAVQLTLLLDEADVLKRTSAGRSGANEMLRTPDLAQSSYKRSPVITFVLLATKLINTHKVTLCSLHLHSKLLTLLQCYISNTLDHFLLFHSY